VSKPLAPYLVVRHHGAEIEWPVLEAESGQKALLCFTDAKPAREYVESHGAQTHGWSVVRMGREEFLRWLRSNLLQGVGLLLVNPGRKQDYSQAVPTFRLLVEMENGDLSALAEASGSTPGNSQVPIKSHRRWQ
jgi:hypothetical protein